MTTDSAQHDSYLANLGILRGLYAAFLGREPAGLYNRPKDRYQELSDLRNVLMHGPWCQETMERVPSEFRKFNPNYPSLHQNDVTALVAADLTGSTIVLAQAGIYRLYLNHFPDHHEVPGIPGYRVVSMGQDLPDAKVITALHSARILHLHEGGADQLEKRYHLLIERTIDRLRAYVANDRRGADNANIHTA